MKNRAKSGEKIADFALVFYPFPMMTEWIWSVIDENLMGFKKELLKLANAKKDYDPIADEIDRLRDEKQNILVDDAERDGSKERIKEMMEFLN